MIDKRIVFIEAEYKCFITFNSPEGSNIKMDDVEEIYISHGVCVVVLKNGDIFTLENDDSEQTIDWKRPEEISRYDKEFVKIEEVWE